MYYAGQEYPYISKGNNSGKAGVTKPQASLLRKVWSRIWPASRRLWSPRISAAGAEDVTVWLNCTDGEMGPVSGVCPEGTSLLLEPTDGNVTVTEATGNFSVQCG